MPAQIELDAQQAADWIAQALSSSGYHTDFSPQSLWEIDRFFDEHSRNGKARPGGLLAENIGSRLFAIGSYVGEVLIRHLQGSWSGDDNDPQAEFNIEVVLPDESHVWPIQRVMKRLANGSEDSIAIYGSALGLSVGEHPKSYKPWWKFWQVRIIMAVNAPLGRRPIRLVQVANGSYASSSGNSGSSLDLIPLTPWL